MNTKQRIYLMADLWPQAALAMGLQSGDREKRLDTISAALGRSIESANEIKTNDDFTRVKNHLIALAKNDKTTLLPKPATDPCASRRAKVLRQQKCLALYLPVPSPRGEGQGEGERAARYIKSIIADTTARAGYEKASYDQAPLPRLLESLTLDQLTTLVRILDRALHNKKTGLRKAAGDTLHAMHIKAGIPCPCKQCNAHNEPF